MKIHELVSLTIVVDGGCKGNGTADAKCYGSFAVEALDSKGQRTQVKVEHFDLPEASTNNQAEYQSMLRAVQYAQGITQFCGKKQIDVHFKTDSQLVVHQVSGAWKCKDVQLMALRDLVRHHIDNLSAQLIWVPREEIVPLLGH